MAIMITGGAGFIGLNIAERLLNDGHKVVSYGLEAPPAAFMDAIEGMPGTLEVVVADVRDGDGLRAAMAQHHVDKLVHGAAITADIARESRDPQSIVGVNFGGTVEVLEAARACGIRRVVQLGSGAIFGSSVKQDGVLDEALDIPVPESLYGITKYAAERLGLRYRSTGRLDLVVARLGVCFGRWEYETGLRDTLSIPLQLTRLAEAGQHAVFGPRLPDDWVYADDVAAAVAQLLAAPAIPSSIYQLASGQRWSAVDWCERLVAEYPGFSFEVTNDEERFNVGRATPTPRPPFSIERLKADIGYRPQYAPAEAFDHYIMWRRRYIEAL